VNLQLGRIHGNVLAPHGGSFPRRARGSVLRESPNHDARRIGRKELIRETQKVLLNFSVKEASHLQDTTERAVEQQRNGESAVSLLAVANMCQSSPKARALFAPLFGFSGAYTDPDFMEWQEKMMLEYLRQQTPAEDEGEPELEETHDMFEGEK